MELHILCPLENSFFSRHNRVKVMQLKPRPIALLGYDYK